MQETYDVCYEPVDQGRTDVLSDNNTQDLNGFQIRCEFVRGNDPSFGAQQSLDPLLFNVGVLLLEGVREPEGNNWKSRFIALHGPMASLE